MKVMVNNMEVKSRLIELIEKYEELRALKEELANSTKEINEEFKKVQEEIVEQMVDDDIPSQGYGDYNYSPQTVTHYSFKSEETLLANGIDKMKVMRENGYDFLVKESINQRSLESALKEAAASDDGIPPEIEEIVSSYDELKVNRRKTRKGTMNTAKKAVEKAKKAVK